MASGLRPAARQFSAKGILPAIQDLEFRNAVFRVQGTCCNIIKVQNKALTHFRQPTSDEL